MPRRKANKMKSGVILMLMALRRCHGQMVREAGGCVLAEFPDDVLQVIRHHIVFDRLGLAGCCRHGEIQALRWCMPPDLEGETLMAASKVASKYGQIEVMKYLVNHGVERGTSDGVDIQLMKNEALRTASESGRLRVVQFLVEHGADVHVDEEFPLKVACTKGHMEVVWYLVKKAGADVNGGRPDPPLDVANEMGHKRIAKFLRKHGAKTNNEMLDFRTMKVDLLDVATLCRDNEQARQTFLLMCEISRCMRASQRKELGLDPLSDSESESD